MAPTNYKFIADKIQNVISVIPNIGIVHNEQKDIRNDEDFKSLCFDNDTNRVAVWFVTRDDGYEDKLLDWSVNRRYSNMLLRGYMGIEESSHTEHIFQQVCDDICTAFPLHTHLISNQMLIHEPPTLRFIRSEMLGIVKCHYAEISIIVREYYDNQTAGLAIT